MRLDVPTDSPRRRRFRRAEGPAPIAQAAAVLESTPPPQVKSRDRLFRRTLLTADLIAGLAAMMLTELTFGAHGPGVHGLLLPAIAPFVNTAMGLYRRDELLLSKNTLDEAPGVFQGATLTAVLAYLFESDLVRTPLGAQLIAFTLLSLTLLTLLLRLIGRTLAQHLTPVERCLLVGSPDVAKRLSDKLGHGHSVKADLVGRLGFEPSAEREPSLGTLADLGEAVQRLEIERVVIQGDSAPPEVVHEAIQSAKVMGVKVSLLPRMFEIVGSSVAFDYVGGLTVLGVRRFGLSRRALLVKRAFDLVGSSVLLVITAPLLAIIALAVRLTSSGPVLFRQTRVGRDGRHFRVLKFRSMVADAEERKRDLFALNEAEGLFKIEDDPRITRVGRALRRTQLDELPQLLNVLVGQMSLVGPRPLVLDEDERIQGWYRRRLHLTPGMTGPWQVAGAARIPLREMVAIDYLYVSAWTLWGDVKILLRTVPCVLGRRGR